jgi:uncharacterized protein YjiS (DUF1127 family)
MIHPFYSRIAAYEVAPGRRGLPHQHPALQVEQRNITMTMISLQPSFLTMPLGRRGVILLMARSRRLLNGFVAAAIARHERRASKAALRHFTDYELKDIGVYRSEIDYLIDRAARTRIRRSRRS